MVRREMARAEAAGDQALLRELRREYQYDGVQTCAVDGMCQTVCPLQINTGDLVRRLRAENQHSLVEAGWTLAAAHWGAASSTGSAALTLAASVPAGLPTLATRAARGILGTETVPLYTRDLPRSGRRHPKRVATNPTAVYFSSCTSRMFGPVGAGGVAESLLRLCVRAGIELITPDALPSLCCGPPWKSKGPQDGYALMVKRVAESLRRVTHDGQLPVVSDASACTEGLQVLVQELSELDVQIIDAVAFVDEFVLPKLPEARRIPSLTVHSTCSSTRAGLNEALLRVAAATAETVIVPEDWGCCAFAGDRGTLHPELAEFATRAQAENIRAAASAAHASLNRTCELGMTRATGYEYQHVLQVLDGALPAPAG